MNEIVTKCTVETPTGRKAIFSGRFGFILQFLRELQLSLLADIRTSR
jgi:hypothetical protein